MPEHLFHLGIAAASELAANLEHGNLRYADALGGIAQGVVANGLRVVEHVFEDTRLRFRQSIAQLNHLLHSWHESSPP